MSKMASDSPSIVAVVGDYIRVSAIPEARSAIATVSGWMNDYNDVGVKPEAVDRPVDQPRRADADRGAGPR